MQNSPDNYELRLLNGLMLAGMTESSGSPIGFTKFGNLYPFSLGMTGNNHLANTFTIVYNKILGRKIHQDDANFASVVGINRSG